VIDSLVLAVGVKRLYAVANTDMGTAPPVAPFDGSNLIGRPEQWKDWGYRATNLMTVAAKAIIKAYYGRAPARSYFFGCSTGGQQGLMEAQRYFADYDGIIAGAPGHNRTICMLRSFRATRQRYRVRSPSRCETTSTRLSSTPAPEEPAGLPAMDFSTTRGRAASIP
jgi:hypothetical protein